MCVEDYASVKFFSGRTSTPGPPPSLHFRKKRNSRLCHQRRNQFYFFLALTIWKADELVGVRPTVMFPLVDDMQRPLSVREVIDRCNYFSPAINTQNVIAVKLNGDFLEVLALASITLASVRCDYGFLAGNSMFRFVATVSLLLVERLWSNKREPG